MADQGTGSHAARRAKSPATPRAQPDATSRAERPPTGEGSGPPEDAGVDQIPAARRAAPPPLPRLGVGPFSLRQVTLAISVVVIGALALTLATRPLGTVPNSLANPLPSAYIISSPGPGLDIGKLAPELGGTDSSGNAVGLVDLHGNPVRLADLRGKVVWLNFWTSWCPPCQAETPILRSMDEAYRSQGLALIGIQGQQTVADGQQYAQTYDLQYTIGADVSGAVFRTYKVYALPTQIFIDQQGVIREIVNGPLDQATATAIVTDLLGISPATAVASAGAASLPAASAAPSP